MVKLPCGDGFTCASQTPIVLVLLKRNERSGAREGRCVDAMDEAERSLVGKIFGEKKANFVGMRNAMIKIWHHKGMRKVVSLELNVYQLSSIVLLRGMGSCKVGLVFLRISIWWCIHGARIYMERWIVSTSLLCGVQVWNIPPHWLSLETRKKVGTVLGNVCDVMIVEEGGWCKEDRHVKILVDLDLTKSLLKGTILKYKQTELWVKFKYEQLPLFCFYCGTIGHNECGKRK